MFMEDNLWFNIENEFNAVMKLIVFLCPLEGTLKLDVQICHYSRKSQSIKHNFIIGFAEFSDHQYKADI